MEKILLVAHHDQELLGRLDKEFTGWNVKAVDDSNGVLNLVQRFKDSVAAVVIDLDLPKQDGVAVLRRMRRTDPVVPIVALTKDGGSPGPGEARQTGATAYAPKPVDHDGIVRTLQRVTNSRGAGPRGSHDHVNESSGSLWLDPAMLEVQRSLEALADWDVPVVFLGETGVGKEVAARELHRLSSRASKPLIKINCAALPSELLESELFGYEKGSFTGAVGSKPGKFEMADGGTILLDEIGDMELNLQAKLLHVLQSGEFDRIGGRKSVRVDVRVLAATHQNLESAIAEGTFREDLFYRLNVASVAIPPLRERKEEIIALTQRFLVKHGSSRGVELPDIPTHLGQALLNYDWPGNVRELENVARRLLVFRQPDAIVAELQKRMLDRRTPSGTQLYAPSRGAVARNGSSVNGIAQNAPQIAGARELNGSNGANSSTNGFPQASGAANGMGVGYAASARDSSSPESFEQVMDRAQGSGGVRDGLLIGQTAPDGRPWSSHDSWPEEYANGTVAPAVQEQSGGLDLGGGPQISTLPEVAAYLKEIERRTIIAALDRCTWNRKRAAKLLKIDYKGLLYKMKKLEIGDTADEQGRAALPDKAVEQNKAGEQRVGSAALVVVHERATTSNPSSDRGSTRLSRDAPMNAPVRRRGAG